MRHSGALSPYSPCGCWFVVAQQKRYLPQVKLKSHTTILATTSSTNLQQTFTNPSNEVLKEVTYTFPLYDGVSVSHFSCRIGEKVIVGIVKERNTARTEYDEAISKGQTAALFEQSVDAADVFTTSIGNVPIGENVIIDIIYLGELKNDAETNGARFTIPMQIAPRYGNVLANVASTSRNEGGIEITVDICLEEGNAIRGIQSPSHPIAVTMGRIGSNSDEDAFDNHIGSLALTLGSTELDKDFVIVVQAKGQDTPRALLETHPDLPNQRAIMTTLIPKFNIPNDSPEIVFVVDRSGSMGGKMHLVIEALKVFLKSLPTSVRFNICSFGSYHRFLFERSKVYDATSLQSAMNYIQPHCFDADFGGTEMLQPVQDVMKLRYKDLPLEVLLLTDGEIWRQDEMFALVTEASKQRTRFFTLGIGSSASSSLVEGIARAGNGFSQWVDDGERIDKRIVRMLKAALTPHIDYKLEIKYSQSNSSDEDDFEIVESFEKSINLLDVKEGKDKPNMTKKVISLFNPKSKDDPTNPPAGRFDHVPTISVPNVLQTPYHIPQLYPHSRSTVYLILGPDAPSSEPVSITLRGKSEHGDLELELPIQNVGVGTTIHQLAAKKAMQELEEGHGWITEAKDKKGKLLKSSNEGKWDLMVEREASRLGTTFQVAGKYCSFIAVLKGQIDTDVSRTSYATDEKELEEYQGNLMILEQGNKKRKAMRVASSSTPGSSALFGSQSGGGSRGVSRGNRGGGQGIFGCTAPPAPAAARRAPMAQLPNPQAFGALGAMNMAPGGGLFGNLPQQQKAPAHDGLFGTSSNVSAIPARDRLAHVLTQQWAQGQQQQQQQQMAAPAAFASQSSFGAPPPPSGAQSGFAASSPSQARSAASLFNSGVNFRNSPSSPLPQANSLGHDRSFNLDFSTLDNPEVLANFDMDSFLSSNNTASSHVNLKAESDILSYQLPEPTFGQLAGGGGITDHANALSTLEKMQKLIDVQGFTGSWKCSAELLTILSHEKALFNQQSDIVTAVKASSSGALSEEFVDDISTDSLVTALVIAWFRTFVLEEADVWEMVVDKARGWLEARVDGSDQVDTLVNVCKKVYAA